MKRYLADRTSLNIIRFVILIIMTAAILVSYYYLSFIPVLMWIIIAILAVAGIFIGSVYLPVFFKSAGYYINSDKIVKKTGVFIKTNQCMKISSVQYITSVTTPFSMHTGFNFIILNAFGGSLILSFLSKKDMDEISSFIFDKIKSR
jgi:uncharacterized membrane protein YdbT with pleckstrin-like domain